MRVRNYQVEIEGILKKHNGCITGFNQLLNEGKFHTNTLAKYLKEMKKHSLITISKESHGRNGQKKYCLVQKDFEILFRDLTAPLSSIDNELKRNDLSSDEMTFLLENKVRLAYYKFNAFNAAKLFAKYVNPDPSRLKLIEKITERMWKIVEDTIVKIPNKERLINTLFESPPKILSLIEYRFNAVRN